MSLLWAATVQPPSSEMSWVSPFDIVHPPDSEDLPVYSARQQHRQSFVRVPETALAMKIADRVRRRGQLTALLSAPTKALSKQAHRARVCRRSHAEGENQHGREGTKTDGRAPRGPGTRNFSRLPLLPLYVPPHTYANPSRGLLFAVGGGVSTLNLSGP